VARLRERTDDFMLKGAASALKSRASSLLTPCRQSALVTPAKSKRRNKVTVWIGCCVLAAIGCRNHDGVDYDVWNPETDPYIAAHFSAMIWAASARARLICCAAFDLPEEPERPAIAIISRLSRRKVTT